MCLAAEFILAEKETILSFLCQSPEVSYTNTEQVELMSFISLMIVFASMLNNQLNMEYIRINSDDKQ
jgi:hypothetical protein